MNAAAWTLHAFGPVLPATRCREAFRAAAGALAGIAVCMALAWAMPEIAGLSLALVAPLGASAVLVFAVPNTPLAQPWSAVVGNVVSAAVAVAVLKAVPAPWAPPLAVGGAILAMQLARALHPPGAAIALLATLDPETAHEAGLAFALVPVGAMTLALVLAGIAFNRLTGRVYPFRQPERPEPGEEPHRIGLSNAELGALLSRFNQSPNIGVADLGRLIAAAEGEAAAHRFDGVRCAEIMTRDLVTAPPEASISELATLFRTHAIKSLPVVDRAGRFRGLILQADVIDALLRPALHHRGPLGSAAAIMREPDRAVPDDLPVGRLLDRLAAQGAETVPVTREGALVGIITRSDIIALLLRGAEERIVA